MTLYPKYIIENWNLIISTCTFHSELITNKDYVQGGGWFEFKDNTFRFFGESFEFGSTKLEDIKKALKDDKIFEDKTLLYSIGKHYKFIYDTGTELIKLN